jgi:hypothetical protein
VPRESPARRAHALARAEMLALGYRELPPSRKRIFYRRIV